MTIKVLIVDDVPETCSNISKLLSFDEEIKVVGIANNGKEALDMVEGLRPDVLLMDINMPIMDGIEATEKISVTHPEISIIMTTVQSELDYIKKAMVAGARDYLVKPFTADQLISSVKKIHRLDLKKNRRKPPTLSSKPKAIAVYSPKGGIGTTTIAVNLAVMMHQLTGKRVALVDLDLQSSDIGVMLDLKLNKTISDIVQNIGYLDQDLLSEYMYKHSSGIEVLLAPPEPQYAELVTPDYTERILKLLKQQYDFIVMDTPCILDTFNVGIMNISDEVLMVLALDLTTVRRVKKVMDLIKELGVSNNFRYVLNRSSDEIGLNRREVEKHLGITIDNHISSNGKVTVNALNKGVPFVINSPTSKISDEIKKLALNCAGNVQSKKKKSLFSF
ncbi:MAG: response regulator/pilus assembly protein [Clostridiales bacterium]|nr:response regulator/pilus assembly protein [Clostridiales bacterium]